ncbi:MAG: DUF2760 domain-containing protein [Bryobacteraceae bacterium]
MNRLSLAIRCFFQILAHGKISDAAAADLRLVRRAPVAASSQAAAPVASAADGALQILGILQRDSRLVDFLMEDISSYSDSQTGAAVRELHGQCRDSLARHVTLAPVIDGVEGTYAQAPAGEPDLVKFVGNVPAKRPAGGVLRHKGWRAAKVDLPALPAGRDAGVVAPAEIEIE